MKQETALHWLPFFRTYKGNRQLGTNQ